MEVVRETIDADALMTRVAQLIEQGRPGAARPLLAAALRLAQPCSALSVLVARVALSEGSLESAEADLDRAVGADPKHPGNANGGPICVTGSATWMARFATRPRP